MTPNNFIVTVIQGPTFITDSLASTWELVMDLIAKGYAPNVYGPGQIYGDLFQNNLKEHEVLSAVAERIQDPYFKGDSADRELVCDFILATRKGA